MGLGSFMLVAFVLGLIFLAFVTFGIVWKLIKWAIKAALAIFLVYGAVLLISAF